MPKLWKSGFVAAAVLMATSGSSYALQPTVSAIDKNSDGTFTYHFSIKLDQSESMDADAKSPADSDFVTIYNFYGMVDGSVKSPDGWSFSSENFGKTPMANGYPLVLPLDIPGTPNLTWTATKPIKGGSEIVGFAVRTQVGTMTQGQYSAQVTQRSPAIPGVQPGASAQMSKQAQIGTITTPTFLK